MRERGSRRTVTGSRGGRGGAPGAAAGPPLYGASTPWRAPGAGGLSAGWRAPGRLGLSLPMAGTPDRAPPVRRAARADKKVALAAPGKEARSAGVGGRPPALFGAAGE